MKQLFVILALLALSFISFAQADKGSAGYESVKPGQTHNNNDVVVENKADSKGKAKVTPGKAPVNGEANSTVSFGNDAKFKVTGVEAGDVVETSSGCKGEIEAKGGTVKCDGSGQKVTITNSAPTGGANVTIVINGASLDLPPGSSITVNT